MADFDVAVIGFGPVGAVLAGLLGQRGLSVLVVDRAFDVFPLPRAAHIDHTGLRTLQELGCLDQLLPDMRINPGLDFVTADSQVLMRVPGDQPSVSGLPASMYFHQPVFDRTVRRVASALPNVDVRLGTTLVTLDEHEDYIDLSLVDSAGNQQRASANWVVGCDGAASTVRASIGVQLEDLEFEEPWLVTDLLLRTPMRELPDHAVSVCDPARPLTSIPMPGNRHRFEFMLLDGEDPARMLNPHAVEKLLEPWVPTSQVVIERAAVYTFHGVIARSWQVGRVFLAGDAAHQMPPFLGQGMCSGLRDVTNLAWKLDTVARHQAPLELLGTYESERRPHVHSIIRSAVKFGRMVCTVDPIEAEVRNRQLLADPAPPSERVQFGLPGLLPGPLVRAGGGDLFIQPFDASTNLKLDDLVGRRFLVLGRAEPALGSTSRWWSEVVGSLVTTLDRLHDSNMNISLLRWMDEHASANVVVVRPDRYVLGTATTLDSITDDVRWLFTEKEVDRRPPLSTYSQQ